MTDTPEHIRKLQLEIWLSKPPGERLLQFLKDNDELFKAFEKAKKQLKKDPKKGRNDVAE